METNRLRQFCAVVESGSLSSAADLLGISIGGLSKSLKTLEAEVGFSLLVPAGRGVVISDRGKFVYQKSRAILDAVSDLRDRSGSRSTIFRLGAMEVFTVCSMGLLIENKFGKDRLDVIELAPGNLEAAVATGQLTCGLTYLPFPQLGLQSLKVGGFTLGAYGLARVFENVKFEEVPFIVPATGYDENPYGLKERDGWPEAFLERKKNVRVSMLSSALDLARRGLGVVFMPDFVARHHNLTQAPEFRFDEMPLVKTLGKIRRDAYLIKRESTEETAEIKKLTSGIRMLLRP